MLIPNICQKLNWHIYHIRINWFKLNSSFIFFNFVVYGILFKGFTSWTTLDTVFFLQKKASQLFRNGEGDL